MKNDTNIQKVFKLPNKNKIFFKYLKNVHLCYMVDSKAQAKRKVRNAKIIELYNGHRAEGTQRSVALELIANKLKVSISTAARITKNIKDGIN